MFGARVPKAAVYKDGDPLAREYDVRAPAESRQWRDLHSVAEPE